MSELPTITDAEMTTITEYAQPYTVAILSAGPTYGTPEAAHLITEHNRRSLALRAAGELVVVLPVVDNSDVHGIGIFDRDRDAVEAILNDDPAVAAGVFVYAIHDVRGLPGDALPPR